MLQCNQNGEFTVLVVADPQCENPKQWEEAQEELDFLVQKAAPSLVVINGDMESNNAISKENWAQFIKPLTKYSIPWVTTNGNHDPFSGEIYQMYKSFPDCLNQLVDEDDVNLEPSRPMNYQLPVYAKDGKTIVFAIYGMDTGDYVNGGWDGVTEKQIAWYHEKAKTLKKMTGKTVPALLCCHIAFAEVKKMRVLDGVENEVGAVTSAKNNQGFFSAIKAEGDIRLAVFGHSHQINQIGVYDGIFLSYAGKLSSGSYHDTLCRGGRVIRFCETAPNVFKTSWLASIPTAQDQKEVIIGGD